MRKMCWEKPFKSTDRDYTESSRAFTKIRIFHCLQSHECYSWVEAALGHRVTGPVCNILEMPRSIAQAARTQELLSDD